MKNIHTNFMAEYILKLTGEYASANRIHDVLNLSLSFTYILANNNKVRNRVKNGRTEYNMEDFIRNLELSYNNNVVYSPLTKEDFEINNFHNWEARNDIEKYLEKLLLDELGQFTSIKDLVEMFKVSKTIWYEALEEGKIMYFTISTRKIIITRSLLPFLREAMSEQYWTIFIKDIEKITFLYWFFLEITYFIDKFKEKKYTLFIRILSIFTQKVQKGEIWKQKFYYAQC